MKNIDGEIFISEKRLPCEQPFQRLLISYDGIVSMCCYDWGNQHPVGFIDDLFEFDAAKFHTNEYLIYEAYDYYCIYNYSE